MMKKVLFAAVIISMSFAACKKENDVKPAKVKIDRSANDGESDGGDTKDDSQGGWGG